MPRARRSVAFALMALAALPATAQAPYLVPLDDESISGLMEIGRLLLPQAKLPDGGAIPAESEADRKTPLLPSADARRVVEAGQVSAAGDWCGLEWVATVRDPFMEAERKKKWSPKQIAFIGVLHDTAQGAWSAELERTGQCGQPDKAAVQNLINKLKR
ncbi:MAG: hypothetical protein H7841_04415 [Magnetospirillum sp. WYHS-4]